MVELFIFREFRRPRLLAKFTCQNLFMPKTGDTDYTMGWRVLFVVKAMRQHYWRVRFPVPDSDSFGLVPGMSR